MMLKKNHKLAHTAALSRETINQWIILGPDNQAIKETEDFGKYIGQTLGKDEAVTTSQIRQIFAKMKSIQAKGGIADPKQRLEFIMLKPYMAYAAGRHNKKGLVALKDGLTHGIDIVLEGDAAQQQQRFENFCKLFEAILAYHRAHGGS